MSAYQTFVRFVGVHVGKQALAGRALHGPFAGAVGYVDVDYLLLIVRSLLVRVWRCGSVVRLCHWWLFLCLFGLGLLSALFASDVARCGTFLILDRLVRIDRIVPFSLARHGCLFFFRRLLFLFFFLGRLRLF